ncbi:MAG: hypothetical protein WDN72_10350 [Alphaproteobacteria bacterium]
MAENPVPAPAAIAPVTLPASDLPGAPSAAPTGEQPMDFLRASRIHVKDGSLFVSAYLVLHPRELDPGNEDALRRKLALTYSLNSPNFFENPAHAALALQLGQLVPVSLATERSKLLEEIKQFNERVQGRPDQALDKQAKDEAHPFAAVLRQITEKPEVDPVGAEQLRNGIALTLLLRLKLNQNGYLKSIDDYAPNKQSPDQILHELADKVGITSLQVREAARAGGIDAVGKLLSLSEADVADVKSVTEAMQAHDFSDQLLQHWTIGRALNRDATLEEKIALGMQARIDTDIPQFRAAAKDRYTVPAAVRAEETRIAGALELLEPIQRKLMYALGYEICFTPDKLADSIAFFPGIYGLHRKAADKLSDIRGTYRIYFSGGESLEQSLRTLVHEVSHNIWPERMGKDEVAAIDALATSDAARFGRFKKMLTERGVEFGKLLDAYQAGSEPEKQAVLQCADALFQPYGVSATALFPYLNNAQEFHVMVDYAHDVLSVEGAQYSRVGYDSPQDRFREVLSRFAELKQVRYRGQPQLLHFLAPGLDQIFEAHYLPHLEKLYSEVMASQQQAGPCAAPPAPPQPAFPQLQMPAEALQAQPVTAQAPAITAPAVAETTVDARVQEQPQPVAPEAPPPADVPSQPATPAAQTANPPADTRLAMRNSSVTVSPTTLSPATIRNLPALAALNNYLGSSMNVG